MFSLPTPSYADVPMPEEGDIAGARKCLYAHTKEIGTTFFLFSVTMQLFQNDLVVHAPLALFIVLVTRRLSPLRISSVSQLALNHIHKANEALSGPLALTSVYTVLKVRRYSPNVVRYGSRSLYGRQSISLLKERLKKKKKPPGSDGAGWTRTHSL